MNIDFWRLMFNSLEQTTDKEWQQFVGKFDREHQEVYQGNGESNEYLLLQDNT